MNILRIFVSYDTNDTDFAKQLITNLQEAGAEVITDNVGLEDTALEQFMSEQLPQCQRLIVVQTPEALQSLRVRAVVNSALKQVQAGQMAEVLRVIAPALNGQGAQAVPLKWDSTPEFDASQDYARGLAKLCLHLGIDRTDVNNASAPPAPSTPIRNPSHLQGHGNAPHVADPFLAQKPTEKDRPLRPPKRSYAPFRWRFVLPSLAIVLVLIVASVLVLVHRHSASATTSATGATTSTGSSPASTSITNLDDNANQWTLLPDQAGVTLTNVPAPTDVTTPSIDGSALQASFTGQSMLVYRQLPPADNATTFEMNLSYYLPSVTPITAIAFTEGKLVNGQWWEWALQWQNSPDGGSWRLWDGNNWENTQVTQSLSENTWHNFQLKGNIVNGQVHYISFTSDKGPINLGQTFAPGSRPPGDQLVVFLQLDGTQESPYQVYIDKLNLQWS